LFETFGPYLRSTLVFKQICQPYWWSWLRTNMLQTISQLMPLQHQVYWNFLSRDSCFLPQH